jgi:hypothetical protein
MGSPIAEHRFELVNALRSSKSDLLRLEHGRLRFSLGVSAADLQVPFHVDPEVERLFVAAARQLLFLIATRSGVLAQASWPAHLVAKLVLGSLLLVIVSFILLAHFTGAPPNSTYIPAHIENGKFVPGYEKPGAAK